MSTSAEPQSVNTPHAAQRSDFELSREISPRRKSTSAKDVAGLVDEQLRHYGIDPKSEFGVRMGGLVSHLYHGHADLHRMWEALSTELTSLSRDQRAARFAAQKFLCFQLAKVLDTLQGPFRKTYQSIVDTPGSMLAKGPYPIFDNVPALFSAKPVITRTATYIYACSEWIADGFLGKELSHQVYSRFLNPTNIALANHIVDVEAGPCAHEYFAWNFNSGMAAVDAVLSHLVGHRDIIVATRNVYGGTYQLMVDWFAKKSNLDISINFCDGASAGDFAAFLDQVAEKNRDRLDEGRQIYVYLESPCNPHGYCVDVPAISKMCHERGLTVICDSTVGTPFLHRPLRRADALERPDFVIHSYTKDVAGHGHTMGGAVIGRNERMFIPKHEAAQGLDPALNTVTYNWDETMFWNVFYIKGSFLDPDKAYEILIGMHSLEQRMLQKCINTLVLAEYFSKHPDINVICNGAPGNPNAPLRERTMHLALPAPLFTMNFEGDGSKRLFEREPFAAFVDALDPAFSHEVSLGQTNSMMLCPALTTHSELGGQALKEAGITPTTMRFAIGMEDPRTLLAAFVQAARLHLDPASPGFSAKFPAPSEADAIYRKHYLDVHTRHLESQPSMAACMK